MNNPCDDGLACNGEETCAADGGQAVCTDGTAVACEEPTPVCTEPDGTCVDPCAAVGCDDEDVCTDDSCTLTVNADGTFETACVNTPVTCDDGDACTLDDACDSAGEAGNCAGTAIVCDDGDICTDDSCDPATGTCVFDPDVCDPGEFCDADGLCAVDLCDGVDCSEVPDDLCTTDSCDSATGTCSNDAVVCDAGFSCDTTTGDCVEVTGETVTLTADVSATQNEGDTGTTSFTFTVTRVGGTAAHTLDYAVTGGSGATDADAADFDGAAFPSGTVVYAAAENGDKTITVLVAGDTNVESDETFTVTLTDPDDAGAELGTAIGTIMNDDSSASPVFTLPTGVGATVGQNSPIGGVSVADADNGTLTVDITTADGFLSFSAAPVSTAVDGNGNAVTTANVLKPAYTLTGTIVNINTTMASLQFTSDRSSGNPGTDQIVFTGTDADGGVGISTLDVNVGIQISLTSLSDTGTGFTGTPGGDVFLATTPSFWGQGDVLVGNGGPDMIEIRSAAAATYPAADVAAFSCTGIQTIWVSSTTGAPTLDNLGDVTELDTITYWPSGAHNLTVDDAPDGCTVNVTTDNGAFGAAVDVDIKDATFGVQGFTVNLLGDSTNGCIVTTLNNGNADAENVTLFSGSRNGTTTTANALSTGAGANIALTTLTITGDSPLDIGTWANGKAASISAAAFTGNLTVTSYAEAGGSLLGGTGNDTLVCGAGAQAVNGGAGNDTMTGGAGADQYTCGAGSDTLLQTSNDATDTCTDFDFGTSTTTVDTISFSEAAIKGYGTIVDSVSANLTSLSNTSAMTYTTLATDAATPGNFGIIGIIGDYANAAAAEAAKLNWTITYGGTAQADDAILVAYKSGTSVRIALIVNTASTTSDGIDSMTDVLILQNTTLADLDSGDFNAMIN